MTTLDFYKSQHFLHSILYKEQIIERLHAEGYWLSARFKAYLAS